MNTADELLAVRRAIRTFRAYDLQQDGAVARVRSAASHGMTRIRLADAIIAAEISKYLAAKQTQTD